MDASMTSEPDLAIASQYADAELHLNSDSDSSGNKATIKEQNGKTTVRAAATADESSSDEEGEEPAKLRAEIEAAMTKEDNKMSGLLTTEHEVVTAPVREPDVELTEGCPVAHCGSILNVSLPGLMMTVKSNPKSKPLDEGSVLCLEDRTVLGCVDEVFGPVLVPLYLVRFENASKMPKKATVDAAVYFAIEHTTYIIPENIKDKGTDASNLFDEETEETEFSDDEAEAASKRGKRKRNRVGAPSIAGDNASFVPFTDYRARQITSFHGGRHRYVQQPPVPVVPATSVPTIPAFQTQPYGGVTKYTQPGGFGGARPPTVYGNTKYTSPRGNGVSPLPMPAYHGAGMPQSQQTLSRGYHQPLPSQYSAHNLPPYPPQAQPPQTPYQQYLPPPTAAYLPHQVPCTPYGQPQPPRYCQPPPPPMPADYRVNGQQQQPPPPPGQPYDQRRYMQR
ncbi:unnamed protein product [Peronospora destructor]|uniref:H/ACA ribonucleoprotein complex non-core subunit NAF1 n=1 Tax=Peronospora destructor TaxID=86335 RepID=A0AAV0SY09_9STRA|nr:unnamed protein product [Peronospora destructor]